MPSADPFARLIPDARAFLERLTADNSRDWFMVHKPEYDARLKHPATLLLDQIAHDIGRQSGRKVTPKLFRANRDVRFSRDKTPYHTHLHMLWSVRGDGDQAPGLFFGISPDYVTLGGGLMGFDKPGLERWRKAVDGPFGDRMASLLDSLEQQGFSRRAPDLKRVPAPYPPDHPNGDLLRHKGLTVWRELPGDMWPSPVSALHQTYDSLAPLFDLLGERL